MEFIDLGNSKALLDSAIMLPTPLGEFVLPLAVDSLFQGGAPDVVIIDMWRRLWPDSFPGGLQCMIIFTQLAALLRLKKTKEAIYEATNPN